MPARSSHSVPAEEVSAGKRTRRQVLISPDEGPNFALRKFIMEPGGGMPLHTNRVEHEQYVLAGRARVVIGDETLEVKKDDVVFIPGGVPHSYEALGDQAFEFLCVVPNLPDETRLVEGVPGGSSGAGLRESFQESPSPAEDPDQDLVIPEDELGC